MSLISGVTSGRNIYQYPWCPLWPLVGGGKLHQRHRRHDDLAVARGLKARGEKWDMGELLQIQWDENNTHEAKPIKKPNIKVKTLMELGLKGIEWGYLMRQEFPIDIFEGQEVEEIIDLMKDIGINVYDEAAYTSFPGGRLVEKIERGGALKLKALQDQAIKKGYKIIGLTASGDDTKQRIKDAYNINFEWYLCDEKALKTVVRSNPGVLELDNGTIKQKVHWNDIEDLEL